MDTTQFDRGLQQIQAKDYPAAIATFTQIIATSPHWADAYCQRGLAHYDSGNVHAAVSDYTQALNIDPKSSKAYYCRALARLALKNLPGTLADVNAALQSRNHYAAAYQLRAIVHRKQGNVTGAIADFETAARLYQEQNQLEPARQCQVKLQQLRPAITAPPPAAPSPFLIEQDYFTQVMDLTKQGKIKQALDNINWVLQVAPQDGKAYCCRGLVHCKQHQFQAAIADFNQAIASHYAQAITYRNRGLARLQLGDIQGAIADCTQAIGLEPEGSENYVARGNAYRAMEHWMGAIEDYGDALDQDANNGQAFLQRGQTYALMGNQAQAIADYQRAITVFCGQEDWVGYQQAMANLKGVKGSNTPASPSQPPPQTLQKQLYQRLLELLGGNQQLADGMIRSLKASYPSRSEEWYLETVIHNLESHL
jgi:tetratricopeptide (TPR) repeat protein